MEIYKGIPYFHESPYQKLSPGKSYEPTPSIKKEKQYRMKAYNYSKSNPMFVKPVKKEELQNVAKTSIICAKFSHGNLNSVRSVDPEEKSGFRETLGQLRSAETARSHTKGVTVRLPIGSIKPTPR